MKTDKQIKQIEAITNTTSRKKRGSAKKIVAVIFILILVLTVFCIVQRAMHVPSIPGTAHQTETLQENAFYLGTYQNTPVLFYKFEGMMMTIAGSSKNSGSDMILSGTPAGSDDLGQYIPYEHYTSQETPKNISFSTLQNPQKLFSFEKYAFIENTQLNDDKTYLEISFIGGATDSTNYIYQVNLTTLESRKIWEHEVRSGNPPYNGGVAFVTQFIPDRYVIFAIIKGGPPPAELPVGVVIKNIQSGTEKTLGIVGDTQIDLKKNTVSYRVLTKTKVPCEGNNDSACFAGDNYKNIHVPTGDVLTEKLP